MPRHTIDPVGSRLDTDLDRPGGTMTHDTAEGANAEPSFRSLVRELTRA
ncbi:hypothetical protein CCE02nite_33150 [Cellulosimicrobium cellulans]|uniref:Uncharacterized protein n=1 Tax=Cellulosimicrobium cellulans TaxID=1710 RepID=A0A4Y4E1S1_CELCE|nr:hypothetical protein CCE02nite_33150 [Cellulosimicrobium cellulans]